MTREFTGMQYKGSDGKPLIGLTDINFVCFAKPFTFTFDTH